MTHQGNAVAYEEDFVAWLEDQARHARRGETDALDLENLAEELEGMARSDRREIGNRQTVLLAHLLKCRAQPKRHSSSWVGTIAEQRDGIAHLIEDSRVCGPIRRKYSMILIRALAGTPPGRCGWRNALFPTTALSASRGFSMCTGFPPIERSEARNR